MFTRYTIWQLDIDRFRVLPSTKRPPESIALSVWRGRALDPMSALIISGIVR
jgi:hypothetical protein